MNLNKVCFLIILTLFLFSGCSHKNKSSNTHTDTNEIKVVKEEKINTEHKMYLSKFDIESDIVDFLVKELTWKTKDNSKSFCAYEELGKDDNNIYARVLCNELYVQDKEVTCKNQEAKKDCFDNKKCINKCETKEVKPYLVEASGISTPVKITKNKEGYVLWQPEDGSSYGTSLERNFPKDILKIIWDYKNMDILQNIIVKKAQNHFNAAPKFDVYVNTGQSCFNYVDCGLLLGEYAIKSSCPHKIKCENKECVIGCYDFFDRTEFPVLKNNE